MTDLDVRYGRRTPRRWLLPAAAALGICALVSWAAWAAFQPRPVGAVLWGYDVVDEHHVRVTVDVHRPRPLAVRCTVYAQAADHAVVGERTVVVPADEREDTRVRVLVTTERRAVNGVLRGCQPAP